MQHHRRSISERIVHALGFEIIAVSITVPIAAWILDRPITQVGLLAVALCTLAMLWNIVYNSAFDYFWPVSRIARTMWVRIWHSLGFEGGYVILAVPIAAVILNVSLLQAFIVDIGFFLFYLPYTFFYNLGYDKLRERIIASRMRVSGKTRKL